MDVITITTPTCIHCKRTSTVEVLRSDWERRLAGAAVQVAFPETSPDFRELIISGTHPECWTAMFGEDDDDD